MKVSATVDEILSLSVNRNLSPNDRMFATGYGRHYFGVGRSAVLAIAEAILARASFRNGEEPVSNILDLGCGHGRVARYLRAAFPEARIHVTDIDDDGVQFCISELGCVRADRVDPNTYDLICLGSVFTHLPVHSTDRLLATIKSALRPNGIAVASTQGRQPLKTLKECVARGFSCPPHLHYFLPPDEVVGIIADYEKAGFGYRNYPHQQDYGVAIGHPSWYVNRIVDDEIFLLTMHESALDAHQDVLAFIKLPDGPQRGRYF